MRGKRGNAEDKSNKTIYIVTDSVS